MRLRTFGQPTLFDESDCPALVTDRRKAIAALAYLCIEGAQTHAHLRTLFWPESTNASALSNVLKTLRGILGGRIESDRRGVRISGVSCDYVELLRASAQPVPAASCEILAHSHRSFFEDLVVPETRDYEDWVSAREGQRTQARRSIWARCFSAGKAQSDLEQLEQLALFAVEDPDLATIPDDHRWLIEVLAKEGRRVLAEQLFEAYIGNLERDAPHRGGEIEILRASLLEGPSQQALVLMNPDKVQPERKIIDVYIAMPMRRLNDGEYRRVRDVGFAIGTELRRVAAHARTYFVAEHCEENVRENESDDPAGVLRTRRILSESRLLLVIFLKEVSSRVLFEIEFAASRGIPCVVLHPKGVGDWLWRYARLAHGDLVDITFDADDDLLRTAVGAVTTQLGLSLAASA